MIRVEDIWNRTLTRDNLVRTPVFVTGLYIFLLAKILFLLPIASDMVLYYQYHSVSVIKKMIVGPGILARQFPDGFLIMAAVLVGILIFIKRTYWFNALGFWISLNVAQLGEPVVNGSDYVLNLMLLLSIPITSRPLVARWKEWQPVSFNFSVLLIQVHIALIYFLSGYDKLMTTNWRNGEAIYFIAELDYYASPIVSAIQSPIVNPSIAWFTIAFELLFPFLIWFRPFRNPLLLAGVIFHLGIIYFLNLPDFGLLMIICYAIFLEAKKMQTATLPENI